MQDYIPGCNILLVVEQTSRVVTNLGANASKRKYLYKSEQTKMLAAQKQIVEQRQQQRDGRSTIRVATGLGTTKVMQVVETAVAFGDGDAIVVVIFL